MKIDNKRNTYRIWLSRLVITIVFTLIILVLIFVSWFDNPDLPHYQIPSCHSDLCGLPGH